MKKLLRYADLEDLRESMKVDVERLDEGLFDRFRNYLSKKLGGDIAKADRILSMYSQAKQSNLNELGKIRANVMAANQKASKDPKAASTAKELTVRSEEAIARINKATADKLEAVEKQIQMLLKGKSERIRTYIDAKKAEIDWVSAQKELAAAKKYASEEEIERLTQEVESEGKIAKNFQNKLQQDSQGQVQQDKEDINIKAERDKLSKLREEPQTNEGLIGDAVRGITKNIKKGITSKRHSGDLQTIASDFQNEVLKLIDDYFDAKDKLSDIRVQLHQVKAKEDRIKLQDREDRMEEYLKTLDFNTNISDLESIAYKKAKAVIGKNTELRTDFEEMMEDAMRAIKKAKAVKIKSLEDKERDADKKKKRDKEDAEWERKNFIEETPEEEVKKETPKNRDKTLKEFGIDDAGEFVFEDDDIFWDATKEMSKENLKILFGAAKRRYNEIENDLETELKGYKAQIKNLEGKADTKSLTELKELKKDMVYATKGATEDMEMLLDRMDKLKSKIETEFHGIR